METRGVSKLMANQHCYQKNQKKGGHVQSKHSIISDYSNICGGGKGLNKSSKQVLAKAETQETEEKKLTWKKKKPVCKLKTK